MEPLKKKSKGGGVGWGEYEFMQRWMTEKKLQLRRSEGKKFCRVNYIAGLTNCTCMNGTLAVT